MITALRDARVGLRLATAFGLIGLLLVGCVGAGLWGDAGQDQAADHIDASSELLQDVDNMKRGSRTSPWRSATRPA